MGKVKKWLSLDPWFSNRGNPCLLPSSTPFPSPLEDIWQCLEMFLFVTIWWGGYHRQVLVSGQGCCLTMHRSATTTENYPTLNINRAVVEKPWTRWGGQAVTKTSLTWHLGPILTGAKQPDLQQSAAGPAQAEGTWKQQVQQCTYYTCVSVGSEGDN